MKILRDFYFATRIRTAISAGNVEKCGILEALENGERDLLIDCFEFVSYASETGKVLS